MKYKLLFIFFVSAIWVTTAFEHKLNFARLLLPAHPATLKVKLSIQGPKACFKWSTNRNDLLSVRPLNSNGECSDSVEVETRPRISGPETAVVSARNIENGGDISCVVMLDDIARITIEHTTTLLFANSAPAPVRVVGFNKDDDRFTTLGGLPFQWSVIDGASIVRLLPYELSYYTAPEAALSLKNDSVKYDGILIEGLATGSAVIEAKLSDPAYAGIEKSQLKFIVIENLLLTPSGHIFVTPLSRVKFSVHVVTELGVDAVEMPSAKYSLNVRDEEIAKFNSAQSSIIAANYGSTDIFLTAKNVDVSLTQIAASRFPSTKVHVVEPSSVTFSVSSGSWILERGKQYQLMLHLKDANQNDMIIPDNARFETVLPTGIFDVSFQTLNSTFLIIEPTQVGKYVIRSKLKAFILDDGEINEVSRSLEGEQTIHIFAPIEVQPTELFFPYIPSTRYDYTLKATGGSGTYSWFSANSTVATVDENSGIVYSGLHGRTRVRAHDRRNQRHWADAQIGILNVIGIGFGKTRKEALIGKPLQINVQFFGIDEESGARRVAFSYCPLEFSVQIEDETIFALENKHQPITEGTGCTSFALRALKSGDTRVTIHYETQSATIDISAYPELTAVDTNLMLSTGNDAQLQLKGGPRPWILDGSKFFTKGDTEDEKIVSVELAHNLFVKCKSEGRQASVKVLVGNAATPSNPLPAVESLEVQVCCGIATRLVASVIRPHSHLDGPKCPVLGQDSVFAGVPFKLSGRVFMYCAATNEDHEMHGVERLNWHWKSKNTKLLSVEHEKDQSIASTYAFAQATPHNKEGQTVVTVEVTSKDRRPLGKLGLVSLQIDLISRAHAEPSSLVLLNHPSVFGIIKLNGGSGFFSTVGHSPKYSTSVKDRKITLTPNELGSDVLSVIDLCGDPSPIEISVKVTNISSFRIIAPSFAEVSSKFGVFVEVIDAQGEPLPAQFLDRIDIKLTANSENVDISKEATQRFKVSVHNAGQVHLFATAIISSDASLKKIKPHVVEIFSPLKLLPKVVTLVPESTFQLEILGGPRVSPIINFALNTTKHLGIMSNGLITSTQSLGTTLVNGFIDNDGIHGNSDSVIVKVVSLAGIKIELSTLRAFTGTKISARVNGLNPDETPFAFGGALYPFRVSWNVSDPSIASLDISPLGAAFAEPKSNRFAVSLSTKAPGQTVITVTVTMHKSAKKHFQNENRVFSDQVILNVEPAMGLSLPRQITDSLQIAPGSLLDLRSVWPNDEVSWSVPNNFANFLRITNDGLLQVQYESGAAGVLMTHTRTNSSMLLSVNILPVASIGVNVVPSLSAHNFQSLHALPVGLTVNLQVNFRDHHGLLLDSAPNKIAYRPHRFDLTDISYIDMSRTIKVTLKKSGETVLQIWVVENPAISTFVRLSVQAQLVPSTSRAIVESDIICFNNPLGGDAIWSFDSIGKLELYNGFIGIARQSGEVIVKMESQTGQQLHSLIDIKPVDYIKILPASTLSFITNSVDQPYVFPVIVAASALDSSYDGSVFGCDEQYSLPIFRAPFTCSVHFEIDQAVPASYYFAVDAIFVPEQGRYACRLDPKSIESDFNAKETNIVVTAKWISSGAKSLTTAFEKPFYIGFDISDKEISLNPFAKNNDDIIVTISATPYMLSHMAVSGCTNYVTTAFLKDTSIETERHFSVTARNVAAGNSYECTLIVYNQLNNQKASILVSINGDGSAKPSSMLADAVSFILLVLMGTCIASIIPLFYYVWLAKTSKNGNISANASFLSRSNIPLISSTEFQNDSSILSSSYSWRCNPPSPMFHSTPINEDRVQ